MPLTSPSDDWLWFTMAGIVVLLAGFLKFQWKRKRQEPEKSLPRVSDACAYLIIHDSQTSRQSIKKSPFRIGRGQDNDLVLHDHSVSRHHAEIIRNRDGVFSIKDLESLNGVFINDKRVKTAVLSEGCEMDIGDVHITFTQRELSLPPKTSSEPLKH